MPVNQLIKLERLYNKYACKRMENFRRTLYKKVIPRKRDKQKSVNIYFLLLDLNRFILLREKIQENPWKKTEHCEPYLRDINFSCREKYHENHWFLQYGMFDSFLFNPFMTEAVII